MKFSFVFAAATFLAFAGGIANAQQQSNDVSIEGNTEINANVGAATAVATGKGSVAENNIGAIGAGSNVAIEGNTEINANVGAATAVATGKGSCAKNNVGVIGGTSC